MSRIQRWNTFRVVGGAVLLAIAVAAVFAVDQNDWTRGAWSAVMFVGGTLLGVGVRNSGPRRRQKRLALGRLHRRAFVVAGILLDAVSVLLVLRAQLGSGAFTVINAVALGVPGLLGNSGADLTQLDEREFETRARAATLSHELLLYLVPAVLIALSPMIFLNVAPPIPVLWLGLNLVAGVVLCLPGILLAWTEPDPVADECTA